MLRGKNYVENERENKTYKKETNGSIYSYTPMDRRGIVICTNWRSRVKKMKENENYHKV